METGAELSWIPADVLDSLGIERLGVSRFRQADGTVLERATGRADVFFQGTRAIDEVVFGVPGDLTLLGHPVVGHLEATRAGHALHAALCRRLSESPDAWTIAVHRELPVMELPPVLRPAPGLALGS